MKAVARQTVIGGLESEQEETAEIEAEYRMRDELFSALRTFTSGYICGSLRGYDAVAFQLNKRWEPCGRPVTAAPLRAALSPTNTERNNFRAEWLFWFMEHCPDVAEIMARKVKPTKTAEQFIEDIFKTLEEEMSHKRIAAVRRKAEAR